MKKIFYIIVVLAVAAVGGGIYFWFLSSKNVPQPPQNQQTIVSQSTQDVPPSYSITDTFPKEDKITIGTANGSVEMNNFYKKAIDTEEGSVILTDNNDYEISYDRSASKFYIYLRNPGSRSKAESELLNILGIGQKEACKLDVSVAAGQTSVGNLSFCTARQ